MYKPISVCIPVYNEEKTIAQTLDSILTQNFPGEMGILVCTNGCTDNTEDIVKSYTSKFNNILLLSTSERGKPNAWNILRRAATNNYLFFTDGDVVIDKNAFSSLYKALEQSNKVAVGARTVPVLDGCSLLTKTITMPASYPQSCLGGRLYAFNSQKLEEVIQTRGYQTMPKNIIHEDVWLSLVIGKEEWTTDYKAKVYHRPYSLHEAVKMIAREVRGHKQIVREYPDLAKDAYFTESFMKRTVRKLQKFKNTFGLQAKLRILSGFLLRKVLYLQAKGIVKREPTKDYLEAWEISTKSKEPIYNYKSVGDRD